MNKKFIYFITIIFLIVMFYFRNPIINKTLDIFNITKEYFNQATSTIKSKYELYFNQAKQIKILTKENLSYQKYINQLTPILLNCKKLKNFQQIKNPKITFTQTISYANLPDISSIYVTYVDKNLTHPEGLIYNNQTAGIVTNSTKQYSLAYLNNNPKSIYTVFIGANKIPGIFVGGVNPKIKYIPKYHKINIGDVVITSGLDKIFYEGVDVGRITKIIQKPLYQEALIKPFYNPLHPTFFYVVKK